MNLYPILLSVITFFSTLSGGLIAAKYRSRFGFLAAFAVGVLIAVSLFDLLPDTHERNPPLVSVIFNLAGFLLIFVLTRILNI